MLEHRVAGAQRGQAPRQRERRPRVAGLALGAELVGVPDERQPRLAGREARARAGPPRDRRALGIAAVDVDDAVGRDLRVGQRELLALVDERRAAQRVEHEQHRARLPRPEARRDARMVVVGQEPRRPRRLGRELLEAVDRLAEGGGLPRQVQEHEVVREVQLVAAVDIRDDPVQVEQVHLTDEHPVVVLVHHRAQPPQPLVDRRLPVLEGHRLAFDEVAQLRILGELLDDVDAKAVDTAVQPEAHHVVHRGLDVGVVPVEVGLLGEERVQVPLLRRLVVRPRATHRLERRAPVVRLVAPHVPVALRVVARGPRLDEPRVLVGAVVGDEVDDDLDVARVRALEQHVEVAQGPEERIDVAIVRYVVAEVGHRRAVERRQPHGLDAQRLEVIEVLGDPAQVADAVAIRVRERAWIDLVDRAALPPGSVHMRGRHRGGA